METNLVAQLVTRAFPDLTAMPELSLGSGFAAVLVALVGGLLVQQLLTRFKYDLYKIPLAVGSVPILGHLPMYWRQKDFTQIFLNLHEKKGQAVLRFALPHKWFVIVADPAITAGILARTGPNTIPRKIPEYSVFDAATGLHGHHSILTEQDEDTWMAIRKALSPAYTPAANKQNYPALLNAYADVGRRIAAAITGQAHKSAKLTAPPSPIAAPTSPGVSVQALVAPQADVQVDHHLLAAAIQTQVEGLFGMEKHNIDVLQAADDIETAISVVHHHTAQPWLKVLHFYLPWASDVGQRFREARLRLSKTVYEPIYEHMKTCKNPSDLSLAACLARFLDPRTGKAPAPERILAEVGNQIMAPETAAHTISWVLYCVATHPEVENKLMKELKEAGMPCDGDLEAALEVLQATFDPLKDLPYLAAVINEAMRMYPAGASASPRLTERPTQLGPYLIPAGVTVFPCLFVLNNYNRSWGDDAREFKPERWESPEAAVDPVTGAARFLPFSAGPKICIGMALGQVAVRTGVALLLSTFRFRAAPRMGTHEEVMSKTFLALTLKVEGGMWLTASHRKALA